MLTADTFNIDTFCHEVHREEQREAHIEHLTPIKQPRPLTLDSWRQQIARAAKNGVALKKSTKGYRHLYLTTCGRR